MEELHQVVSVIALTMGVAWASGINLYAAVLVLGLLGATGHLALPPDLQILTHPTVLMAAGFMYFVEFFADKTPGVDTSWDALHTFIRIPAGAALAAGAVGDVSPAISLAAALIGGGIAAGTHATKAGSRILINTSPEPFSNWTASVAEDIAVVGGLFTALHYPWIFLGILVIFIIVSIWLLPKIWMGIRRLFEHLALLFRGGPGKWPPTAKKPDRTEKLPPPGGRGSHSKVIAVADQEINALIKGEVSMILDLLKNRRSIRQYENRPVEEEKIGQLIEAALRSPSSRSLNPWEFVVITDRDTIRRVSQAKQHGSAFLAQAPLVIAVIADPDKCDVWVEDCSIAAIIVQLTAEDLGLSSCWAQIRLRSHADGHSSEDYVKEVLDLPQNYVVEALIGIGYPAEFKAGHTRESLGWEKVHTNRYQKGQGS